MKTKITLSADEISLIKAVLRSRAIDAERFIEKFGDPHGYQTDNLAEINSVLTKLETAFSRAIAI